MSKYFRYFPEAMHTGRVVTDITKRIRFKDTVAANPFVFLPLTIREGERAEDIAHYYYGSVDYVWIIYLANDIVDPYYDWPLTQTNLENYIVANYSDQANTTGRAVLDWTRNTNITENVLYYENSDGERISAGTYDLGSTLDPDFTAGEWQPIRIYDYEFLRNEGKRHIEVVDKKYAEQINREMKKTLRGI